MLLRNEPLFWNSDASWLVSQAVAQTSLGSCDATTGLNSPCQCSLCRWGRRLPRAGGSIKKTRKKKTERQSTDSWWLKPALVLIAAAKERIKRSPSLACPKLVDCKVPDNILISQELFSTSFFYKSWLTVHEYILTVVAISTKRLVCILRTLLFFKISIGCVKGSITEFGVLGSDVYIFCCS